MCVDINKNVCILLQNKSIKNCQIEIRTQGLENLGKHLGKQAGNLNHSATSYDAKYQPIFDISSFHLFGDVIYCTKNKCFERVFCSFSKHFLSNYTVPWTEEHCIRSLRVKSSHLSMLTCMAYNAVDPLFISPQFRSIILSFTALAYENSSCDLKYDPTHSQIAADVFLENPPRQNLLVTSFCRRIDKRPLCRRSLYANVTKIWNYFT